MHQFPWISLNILENTWIMFWQCQGSEYVWSSYILDMSWVLNVSEFWTWCGSTCKGYTDIWICLNIAHYASVMPEYACAYLNVPKHAWTWLNSATCRWISLKIPEKTALTVSGFSICFIILYIWQGFEHSSVIKAAATDMKHFSRSKLSRIFHKKNLVHKKNFSLIWQVVFKLGYVFCQER